MRQGPTCTTYGRGEGAGVVREMKQLSDMRKCRESNKGHWSGYMEKVEGNILMRVFHCFRERNGACCTERGGEGGFDVVVDLD